MCSLFSNLEGFPDKVHDKIFSTSNALMKYTSCIFKLTQNLIWFSG